MKSQDFIELEDRFGAHNYHPLDVVITRGEGVWVWDVEGRQYMDCLAAYSAVNQGHCHPRLLKALVEQACQLTLTSRAFRNDKLPLLCEQICETLGFDRFLPMNSGAEAVETAIKAARKWGYDIKEVPQDKAEIIVCDGNFHGRTITVVSFSPEEDHKRFFGPCTPGFVTVPYADSEALEKAITPNTVAFLVEPIQGEGGVVVPPEGYLKRVREICTENRVLLIADEIQSGLGRTGTMLACMHEEVKPDVVTIGKALSGGMYPVSGVLASQEVMDVFKPGQHGSTYGGNPLACAVAMEALAVLEDEQLCENAIEQGEYLLKSLNRLESPHVDHYRGKGLWVGIVLRPEAGGARRFCEALKERGILCKETHEHIIRLAPPLVICREEIDWMLEALADILRMD